ncbi:SGNH/GDSL hydrolase family protein [Paraliomyxa miuraensis]|uniref:SGNH/GDSL hydrolase family protein n=1 Tax=Paraliomyxa miuraensis TaxID=376150 RepID=UPI002255AEA1|nr:SGNH/GDSL hydrolase family protein [Paraliomyxa miuraensis]MCX4245584.1 SGNH/GDSL hydrolase family protein [Paraliomyxa miuraensis]
MFVDLEPNAVVFGDSNTWAFGPAWVDTLVRKGWPRSQVVLVYRSGTTPRHWLPREHPLYHAGHGVMFEHAESGRPSIHDALSPTTELVIIGLGGNMKPGTRDDASADALLQVVTRLAPLARIVWRGTPPSTATPSGQVANRATRAGRHQRNGMLKERLSAQGFELLGERVSSSQSRLYVDVLAMHATGPAPSVQPLATGRDVDLEAEQALLASLRSDRWAKDEVAVRGPWTSFVRARDAKPSHVPRDAAADLVAIVAERGALETCRKPPRLPLRATVVDPKALVREGGPRFRAVRGAQLPQGGTVLLEKWSGRYGHVLDGQTKQPLGWTMRSNLELAKPR